MDKSTKQGLATWLVCVGILFGVIAYGSGAMSITSNVNGQAIAPSSVTATFIDAGAVLALNYVAVGPVGTVGAPCSNCTGTGTGYVGSRVTTNGAYWCAAAPTTTNYAVGCGSSGNDTTINTASGGTVTFAANNSTLATLNSSGTLQMSAAASGTNAIGVSTNGAYIDFGAGVNDRCSSNGTTVTCADAAGTTWAVFGGFQAGNANFTVNGTTGAIGLVGASTVSNTMTFASNVSLQLANMAMKNTAPTISSGFGTSPSIVASNGSLAFQINVGTGGVATSGVIGLPTATTGWVCNCQDITSETTTVTYTKQTASSTTTCTVGSFTDIAGAGAWAASDKLNCIAVAY